MEERVSDVSHVVIIGGGFGGLAAARALKNAPVTITLVDRQNHHLFQPLLYQVATAALSPAEIAMPIRTVLRSQVNVTVRLDEVTGFDLDARRVELIGGGRLQYAYLIVAAGARTYYFGHDDWEPFSIGLKDLEDAVEIRQRILIAFEVAEKEQDWGRKEQLLTFIVIGGGPTGVELAGALAELSSHVLEKDFRHIDPVLKKVILLEGADRILLSLSEDLARCAVRDLEHLGVRVFVRSKVTNIDAHGVYFESEGREEFIASATVLWAAGVTPNPLAEKLGVPLVRGWVPVEPDCSIKGHPEVFVVGDMAFFTHQGGRPLPGVAPVAMQQGRSVANNIIRSIKGEVRKPFHYVDKGNLATIGRSKAVIEIGGFKASGFFAWLAWLIVHIFYLIGFHNRVIVLFRWAWAYFTFQRGARLITGRRLSTDSPKGGSASRV